MPARKKFNFDQINKFESLGTGTMHVGAPPKTIINDGMPTLKPKFVGDHRMETTVARQQYPAKASTRFKLQMSSSYKRSANQITKAITDTSCSG